MNDKYGLIKDLQEVKYAIFLIVVLPGCDRVLIGSPMTWKIFNRAFLDSFFPREIKEA